MSRKVYISDSMAADEQLMEVGDAEPVAALLWPWFLLALDDWGRGDASPRVIKARMFPENPLVTKEVIGTCLDLYAAHGLVTTYEVGRKRYFCVDPDSWFAYQTHIHKDKRSNDKGSRYPAPGRGVTRTEPKPRATPRDSAETREDARDHAESRASLPPSLPPTTHRPPPSPSLQPSENAREVDPVENPVPSPTPPPEPPKGRQGNRSPRWPATAASPVPP